MALCDPFVNDARIIIMLPVSTLTPTPPDKHTVCLCVRKGFLIPFARIDTHYLHSGLKIPRCRNNPHYPCCLTEERVYLSGRVTYIVM